MNPSLPTNARPPRSQSWWLSVYMLPFFFALPAHAQSASNFKVPTPKAAETKPAAPTSPEASTPKQPAKSSDTQPSRFIGADNLTAHLQALGSVLTGKKRATDPFGQLQDPEAKPIIKTAVATTRRAAPMQATPFADIVRLIKVTTVMPSEKKFLLGTRSIKQGDRIPLSFRGRSILVEVVSVSSRSIEFRNTENNETAAVSLNMMPVGMTPGNDGITAPGMVADRPNAPINLDGGSL